ncbi:N-acetyllactosaminide beta-1,3-N-acetylglucosaminyltransferase 4-like [Uranotaenia lowii]|uniref:N-acetyllactosaminide beta-1,3-N-acetylglucosaminyltransferase 4-like n=1 Tax=Uranotaenia lowii TaxID=190385 RepID=UPI00247A3DA8|nr:N-acetyllactosaminide beta-1,3-N-acetylglucosaminyltransferase 4-like [Uranotaenia lowii]
MAAAKTPPEKYSDPPMNYLIKTKDFYKRIDNESDQTFCPNMGANVTLLMLITSSPDHNEQRLSIRRSWGSYSDRRNVSIRFVLGRSLNQSIENEIMTENLQYGDLVRGNFIDSYWNLTLKTITMLDWTSSNCPEVKFILKTDDDMFINVPRLLAFVESHASSKRTIFGRLVVKWKPARNKGSKHYITLEQYFPPIFPPFTTGPAYLMTSDVVADLYKTALAQTYNQLEDVFITGVVAQLLNIKRINMKEFLNQPLSPMDECTVQKFISIHRVNSTDLLRLWEKLSDDSLKCG